LNKLQRDKILEPKWFNLYGPSNENSLLNSLTKSFKKNNNIEEYIYYGRVLANARLVKIDMNDSAIDDVFNINEYFENKNLKTYSFWLDLYQLNFFEDSYNGKEVNVEYQFSTFIRDSEISIYDQHRKKFYWKDRDRRIKKVKIEMPSEINQVPYVFLRIKINKGFLIGSSYVGYIKFDIKPIINNLEVKPSWEKIRKCEYISDKLDEPANYIGELLCSFNVFIDYDNSISKRPALMEKKNFKKYILVSRIYMGKNFPKLPSDNSTFCEVQFYNDLHKPIKTKVISDSTNPNWSETLLFTVKLNENLEFSHNIKLLAKTSNIYSTEIIGQTEIPVTEIEVYRDSSKIEKYVYKKAKWFTLNEPYSERKCYILASFFLVMSHKFSKDDISFLNNLQMDPEITKSYFMLFIIGVRNLSEHADKGYIRVKYDDEYLEKKKDNKNLQSKLRRYNTSENFRKFLFNITQNQEILSYNYLYVK